MAPSTPRRSAPLLDPGSATAVRSDDCPLRTSAAHANPDHPVSLLGEAMYRGAARSSNGITVRHNGGARGTGPYGVDCCDGMEFGEALYVLDRLAAVACR